MTGPEFAFEVRPQVLAAYAETLHACAANLASAGETVAAVRVERGWFGKMPQSGFLADRYAAHQRGVVAEAAALAAWLGAATAGLAECADRYSAADRVVAGAAGAVEAALLVGIEIPEIPEQGGRAEAAGQREQAEGAEQGEQGRQPEQPEQPEQATASGDEARG